MQTATVNVPEYLSRTWQTHQVELAAFESRQNSLAVSRANRTTLKSTLEKKRDEKIALKWQAAENGLDTTPLDKDVLSICAELETLEKQSENEKERMAEPGPVLPFDWRLVSRFSQHLRERGQVEAEVLSSLDSAAVFMNVSPRDLSFDKEGLVEKARIRFLDHQIGEVPISLENGRFAKSYRPALLSWVPPLAGEPAPIDERSVIRDQRKCLFIVEDRAALLLPSNYTFNVSDPVGREASSTVVTGKDAPFILASELLQTALKDAGNALRLDQTYHDPFLSRIREEIISLTLEKPRWAKKTETMDSDGVMATIRDDLSQLVKAPWSDDLRGNWAKFKYTLENGERPRVWQK